MNKDIIANILIIIFIALGIIFIVPKYTVEIIIVGIILIVICFPIKIWIKNLLYKWTNLF